MRVVGEEQDHSAVGYRRDDEGKDNVCCAHSLLQRINKKMQVQVNVSSLSGPPEPIFLIESHTALLGPDIQSESQGGTEENQDHTSVQCCWWWFSR